MPTSFCPLRSGDGGCSNCMPNTAAAYPMTGDGGGYRLTEPLSPRDLTLPGQPVGAVNVSLQSPYGNQGTPNGNVIGGGLAPDSSASYYLDGGTPTGVTFPPPPSGTPEEVPPEDPGIP